MKWCALTLCLLTGSAQGSHAPGNPVSKVFTLLKDLRTKIEKDGEDDEKNYDKYMCWCDEVKKSKADLIEEQKKEIEALKNEIEEGQAKDEKLDQEIKKSQKEQKENKDGQGKGEESRKEDAEKRSEDKEENTDNIKDLNKAEKALKKEGGNGASDQIKSMVKNQIENTQEKEEEASKVEATAVANFESWMSDMKAELGLLEKEEKEDKTEDAEVEEEIAEDNELKTNTEEQKKADEKFLNEAEKSCTDKKAEYDTRVKLRVKELGGVNKALEILTEKRALFDKTFKEVPGVSFLQLKSQSGSASAAAHSAYAALKEMASQTHSIRLASIAATVQEARAPAEFAGVLKAIDEMFKTLSDEGASDKKKKDHCNVEYQSIAKKTKKYGFLVKTSEAKISKFEARVDELTAEVAAADEELAATRKTMADMLEQRKKENAAFLAEKKMDQDAIAVLKDTRAALAEYYDANKKDGEAFLQTNSEYDPNKLSDKRQKLKRKEHQYGLSDKDEQSNAASGVLALIERIMTNLEGEIKDGQEAEAKAQERYMKMDAELKATDEKLVAKKTDATGMKTNTNTKKDTEDETKDGNQKNLDDTIKYRDSIKKECDWILEKFDERASKRDAEKSGLQEAKAALSGAAFVQQSSGMSIAAEKQTDVVKSVSTDAKTEASDSTSEDGGSIGADLMAYLQG
eukprot:TRINITY_DN3076_c0_g1_i6.p1 TRINITY_DN3076_c0_g1~~TRINITY_DN3076_c0_g1_i6.p1  ORF type:complete len:686 (-),score=255.34 TRINITY_DN3076_c0_g1_i6:281-2338(-)